MKSSKSFQFSLKWLLILVFTAAIAIWIAKPGDLVTANFEITNNGLQLDNQGLVNGKLGYRYSRVTADGSSEYFDFLCLIEKLNQKKLLDLKPGQRFKMRYRLDDFGPLKKQNVYTLFLTNELQIKAEYLKDYENLPKYTEIIIYGDEEL